MMLSRHAYAEFVYSLPMHYPSIRVSTLVIVPSNLAVAQVTGLIALGDDIVLCVYELLDFEQGVIESYRYEVTRALPPFTVSPLPDASAYCGIHYAGKEKLYWYDSWPHPNYPHLAATHPHHKHVQPDIKHNRIPAPELHFDRPNLPFLLEEIQQRLLAT